MAIPDHCQEVLCCGDIWRILVSRSAGARPPCRDDGGRIFIVNIANASSDTAGTVIFACGAKCFFMSWGIKPGGEKVFLSRVFQLPNIVALRVKLPVPVSGTDRRKRDQLSSGQPDPVGQAASKMPCDEKHRAFGGI